MSNKIAEIDQAKKNAGRKPKNPTGENRTESVGFRAHPEVKDWFNDLGGADFMEKACQNVEVHGILTMLAVELGTYKNVGDEK